MRFLLVDGQTLRVVNRVDDGIYRIVPLAWQGETVEYLHRFSRNRVAMKRLEDLLREFDPKLDRKPLPPEQIVLKAAVHIRSGRVYVAEATERFHAVSTLEDPIAGPPVPPPPVRKIKTTTWIELQFFDDRTGKPVNNLRVVLKTPDGNESFRTTDSEGLIRADPIDPGTCDAWSEMKGATMEDTLGYVGDGEPAKPPPEDSQPSGTTLRHFADVERHKVKNGETLDGLAKKAKTTWQELAKFNWGTDVPDEINKKLRDEVGCTRKTTDGQNYIFDRTDHPGIVFIPTKWERDKLATGTRHVFRGKGLKRFFVILENDEELRIPETSWEATLADGSSVGGKLGLGGVDAIEDPPEGDVEVFFPDIDDIEAKSLAASTRKAFDDRDPTEIHRLFRYPKPTIQRAIAMYDRYYNTYRKKGLREDIKADFSSDPDGERIFFGYLADVDAPPPPEEPEDFTFDMD